MISGNICSTICVSVLAKTEWRTTGDSCILHCVGTNHYKSQSCRKCTEYVTCSNGSLRYVICETGMTWDQHKQNCSNVASTTCNLVVSK